MSDKVQSLSDPEQAENKRMLIAELEEATRRIRSVSEAEARAVKNYTQERAKEAVEAEEMSWIQG